MDYPTEEGKTLGAICRSYMLQSNVSASMDLSDIPFYTCFAESKTINVSMRTPNLLAQYALGKGMDVFVNNYMFADILHGGTVIPGEYTTVAIAAEDKFSPGGQPKLPPLAIWMTYSFPSMFGDLNETNYVECIDNLFKRLAMWLATPSIFKLNGVCKAVMIAGVGVVSWNGWIGAVGDGIKEKVKFTLAELWASNPTDPLVMFEKAWDIISSGIVEMLSYNSVTTVDVGVAVVNNPTTLPSGATGCIPGVVPYTGGSVGKLSLNENKGQNATIGFQVPFVPVVLPKLDIQFKLKLPKIKFPKIRIKDREGNWRVLEFEINFDKMMLLTAFVQEMEKKFTDLINEVIATLLSICYDKELVITIVGDFQLELINITIPEMNAGFLAVWADEVAKFGQTLIDMAWQAVAAIPYALIMNAYYVLEIGAPPAIPPIPGLTKAIDYYQQIDGMINGINKAIETITKLPEAFKKLAEPINEVIKLVNAFDISKYINICPEMIAPPVPTVPTLPPFPPLIVPTLPPLPSIPGVPPPINPYDATLPPPASATEAISAIVDPIVSSLVLPSFTINLDIAFQVDEVIRIKSILPCTESRTSLED